MTLPSTESQAESESSAEIMVLPVIVQTRGELEQVVGSVQPTFSELVAALNAERERGLLVSEQFHGFAPALDAIVQVELPGAARSPDPSGDSDDGHAAELLDDDDDAGRVRPTRAPLKPTIQFRPPRRAG